MRDVNMTHKCLHCGEDIRYFSGRLWHSSSPLFPQYCKTKYDANGEILPSVLHEPEQSPATCRVTFK